MGSRSAHHSTTRSADLAESLATKQPASQRSSRTTLQLRPGTAARQRAASSLSQQPRCRASNSVSCRAATTSAPLPPAAARRLLRRPPPSAAAAAVLLGRQLSASVTGWVSQAMVKLPSCKGH